MERLYVFFCNAGIKAIQNEPLAQHSTFRIGGAAKLALFPASLDQMLTCLQKLTEYGVRYAVIGKGSNVVFSDDGFDGVIVFSGEWNEILIEGERLTVSAGVTLASLAAQAQRLGLSGLEFAHGIPGTVGGAVFMNAGAFGGSIADVCESTTYFEPETGKIQTVRGPEHAFGYRSSFYAKYPQYTVLSATFRLKGDDGEAILARMNDYAARRRSTQPLEYPSAGSVFKRPEGYFAGKLIEDCGLKGARIGGAEVSEKHAGFIVNRGGATSLQVRALVELIRARVYVRCGVRLECEIRFL